MPGHGIVVAIVVEIGGVIGGGGVVVGRDVVICIVVCFGSCVVDWLRVVMLLVLVCA